MNRWYMVSRLTSRSFIDPLQMRDTTEDYYYHVTDTIQIQKKDRKKEKMRGKKRE